MDDLRPRVDFNDARAVIGPEGKPAGRSTLRRRMASDPTFPKPKLIAGRLQFYRHELLDWIAKQPRRQYTTDKTDKAA